MNRLVTLVAVGAAAAIFASPASAGVEITTISYNPPGRDYPVTNTKLNAEYVMLINYSSREFRLRGWRLRDGDGNVYPFGRRTIRAWSSLTVHTGAGKNTREHVYWRRSRYVWDNGRDRATLTNRTGRVVDRCAYTRTSSGIARC